MLRLFLISLFFLFGSPTMAAQLMNPDKSKELISKVSDTVRDSGNSIQFVYKNKMLLCVYDENANRMRIISPIVEREKLDEEQVLNALVANFHTALDVKYALSDEIIWSVYNHPLQELTNHQVVNAIDQVYRAAVTFGTTYSSTNLVFLGTTKKKRAPQSKKLLKER